jgi:hypothetical protein
LISVGNLAIVKTTEEPVLVLSIDNMASEYVGLSGTVVTVRRPRATQNGTEYEIAKFFCEELETPIERGIRIETDFNHFKAMREAGGDNEGQKALAVN